jgi:hypothetical protein
MSKGTKELITSINDKMFEILKSHKDEMGVYAFKGGYVLSNYKVKEGRSTSDIDMSIESDISFYKIVDILAPFLNSLKNSGYIYNYKVKKPMITKDRNISGGISLYKKSNDNSKAFKFCGIDISIHDLSYGVVQMKDGIYAFSDERSIADKLSLLFNGDVKQICRRCRDIYDIYLYSILNTEIDVEILSKCLNKRSVCISNKSNFEKLLSSSDFYILYDELSKLISDGNRVDLEFIIAKGITVEILVDTVLSEIDFLRRLLC